MSCYNKECKWYNEESEENCLAKRFPHVMTSLVYRGGEKIEEHNLSKECECFIGLTKPITTHPLQYIQLEN